MDNLEPGFKTLLEKINALRVSGEYDLSMEEDLSMAVMNLISLEEHFFFTGEKTGKGEYFDLLTQVRDMRKKLLAKLTGDNHEGETWCISKHLLASTMRLIETGTKLQANNKKHDAKEIFDQAYTLYTLFWGVRLNLISAPKNTKKPMTYQDIMSELIDCCKE